jgi:hypothetical protein
VVTRVVKVESSGSCFGYAVRSDLSFRFLREGGGTSLEIREGRVEAATEGLLREWSPPDSPVHMRLHKDPFGYHIWVEDFGWIRVEPGVPRITVPPHPDLIRREERIWGLPTVLCVLQRGDVPLHAACVEVEGRALIFAAPGRFGKTTLAAAFAQAGYRVLGEDLVCFRPGADPAVIPGPALLRLRRDVADMFRIRGAVEVGRDDERVHLALGGDRGTCAPVPVAGVALLLEGDTPPRLDLVPGPQAVRDLWAVSFNLPTEEDRARCFAAVARLTASTPVWHLTRRRRIDELPATIQCLVDAVRAQPA